MCKGRLHGSQRRKMVRRLAKPLQIGEGTSPLAIGGGDRRSRREAIERRRSADPQGIARPLIPG